jgi:hypothetical protein
MSWRNAVVSFFGKGHRFDPVSVNIIDRRTALSAIFIIFENYVIAFEKIIGASLALRHAREREDRHERSSVKIIARTSIGRANVEDTPELLAYYDDLERYQGGRAVDGGEQDRTLGAEIPVGAGGLALQATFANTCCVPSILSRRRRPAVA